MCTSSALLHVESGFVIKKANYFSFSQEDELDKKKKSQRVKLQRLHSPCISLGKGQTRTGTER